MYISMKTQEFYDKVTNLGFYPKMDRNTHPQCINIYFEGDFLARVDTNNQYEVDTIGTGNLSEELFNILVEYLKPPVENRG